MPLVSATLEQALLDIFTGYPETAQDAADRIAAAYGDYASAGIFGTDTIPSVSSQVQALSSSLLTAFQASSSSAVANAFASGLAAFWTGLPTSTGAAIGCPGAASLTSLASVFDAHPSAEQAANQIATALHTATATATAMIVNPAAPPPTIVVPIA